jgi:TolA-binding protein
MSRANKSPFEDAKCVGEIDRGLRIERPRADWRASVDRRRLRRVRTHAAIASAMMLSLLAAAVWFTEQPRMSMQVGSVPQPIAKQSQSRREAESMTIDELQSIDRELERLNRTIALIQREQTRQRSRQAAASFSAASASPLSDAFEDGAMALLRAAKKATREGGEEAARAIYRRLVEIFPETRSAEIARRELM